MKKKWRRLIVFFFTFSFALIPVKVFAHGGEEHEHVTTSVYSTIVITDLVLFVSGFLIIYRLIKGKWIGKWAWIFIASLLVSYLFIYLIGEPLDLIG
jgi:uncharacterized membrane protein